MNEQIEKAFTYHAPKAGQVPRYEDIRATAKELAVTIDDYCPDSLEKSLALTKLDEAVMWANAAIARNEGDTGDDGNGCPPGEPSTQGEPGETAPGETAETQDGTDDGEQGDDTPDTQEPATAAPPYLRLPAGTPFSSKLVVGEQMTIPLDTNIPRADIDFICTTGFISIDRSGVVTGVKAGMSVIVIRYGDVMINLMITVV